jgi:hypothetical protein
MVFILKKIQKVSQILTNRGDLKGERRIISKRCMIEYIPGYIFRSSFKFCTSDKFREKMEACKTD